MYEQRNIRLRQGEEDDYRQDAAEKCHYYEDPSYIQATDCDEASDDWPPAS